MAAGEGFPRTSWTLLVAADGIQAESRQALDSLCKTYWYPLYAYIRRRGMDSEEARDLTQDFFVHLLNGKLFEKANPVKGRFRSFLMQSLRNFLADAADRRNSLKRGSGLAPLPFEISDGEARYEREAKHDETPERIFERRWARALLDHVMQTLREDFIKHGRLDHFNALRSHLAGTGDAPYAELARKLDISESALKSGIHRLRKRYRDLLRAEVAATVDDPTEVDAELRYLLSVIAAKST